MAWRTALGGDRHTAERGGLGQFLVGGVGLGQEAEDKRLGEGRRGEFAPPQDDGVLA